MNKLRQYSVLSTLFEAAPVSTDLSSQVKWIKLSGASGAGVLSMANFDLTARTLSVSFPSPGTWYDYFNPPDSVIASGGNRDFQLKPGEYRVYVNRFLPLPGTILRFTGVNTGLQNDLNWQVLEEQEVSSYELQRSPDSLNFYFVSSLNVNGTGAYTYTDDVSMLSTNVYFYRLKVVFADGSYRYSRIIRLQSDPQPVIQFSFHAMPNPFFEQLVLHIGSPSAGNSELRVLDMAGRLIIKKTLALTTGMNNITLSAQLFPSSGVYMLQLSGPGYSKTISVAKFNYK